MGICTELSENQIDISPLFLNFFPWVCEGSNLFDMNEPNGTLVLFFGTRLKVRFAIFFSSIVVKIFFSSLKKFLLLNK